MTNTAVRPEFTEWDSVIEETLLPALRSLRDHIEAHDFFVGCEDVVAEIDGAIDIWQLGQHGIWADEYDEVRDSHPCPFDIEDDFYDAFMDYLKAHMRKWWC